MTENLELTKKAEGSSQAETKTIPMEKQNIPDNLKDKTITKTKVTTLKKMIEDKLLALKDLATLEIHMPVQARARERFKTLKAMGDASHIKIKNHWKTTNPKMHITKLKMEKLNNSEAEITFSVFETDKNGNKQVFEQATKIVKEDGSTINRVTSAEYRIAYEVTERIVNGKAIEREIMNLEVQ